MRTLFICGRVNKFPCGISEDMFKRSAAKHEKERVDRQNSLDTLTRRIQSIKQNTANAETWANQIRKYTQLETLDTETILLLIDKIMVGESQVIDGKRVRDIKVFYNHVGDIERLASIIINSDTNITENVNTDSGVSLDEREAV